MRLRYIHIVPAAWFVTIPKGPFAVDSGPKGTKIGFYTPETPTMGTKSVENGAL